MVWTTMVWTTMVWTTMVWTTMVWQWQRKTSLHDKITGYWSLGAARGCCMLELLAILLIAS